MAQKLRGVGGVLGNLISPEPATAELPPAMVRTADSLPAAEPERPEQADAAEPPAEPGNNRPKPTARIAARRGRPPGQKPGVAADKEKVTLRLNKDLMDDYREWSWEERCQLGELVERAMIQHRKQRSRQKSQ